MSSTPVVSAEHAVECAVAGVVWQADILDTRYLVGDTLLVNARLLRLTPGSPKERWQFRFTDALPCWQRIGAPGTTPLTRPVKSPFARPSVLYEIADSDWLPSCMPVGGASGTLHHYVVVDDEQNLALHVAATNIIGQQLEEEDANSSTASSRELTAAAARSKA